MDAIGHFWAGLLKDGHTEVIEGCFLDSCYSVWSEDHRQQHHLGACLVCRIRGTWADPATLNLHFNPMAH